MKWKLAAALILVTVCTLLVSARWGPRAPTAIGIMPSLMDNRVRMSPVGHRETEYYPGGIAKKYMLSELEDGRQEHFWYRTDGTLSEAKTYSALIEGGRVLLRHSIMTANGRDYLSDNEFSASGELVAMAFMVTPSMAFRYQYHPGGALKAFELFEPSKKKNGGWSKILADEFHADSSLASLHRRTAKGFEVLKYRPDMTLLSRFVLEGKSYKETWYYNDGRTEFRVVDQDVTGTVIKYFRRDGLMYLQHEIYGNLDIANVETTYFEGPHKRSMDKSWHQATENSKAKLYHVGYFENGNIVYRFHVDKETGKVTHATHYLERNGAAGADIRYTVRPDGFLSRRIHRDAKGNTISDTTYEEHQKVPFPIKLDATWLLPPEMSYLPPPVIPWEPSGH